jgi:uncharacterized protein (DUF342 family)
MSSETTQIVEKDSTIQSIEDINKDNDPHRDISLKQMIKMLHSSRMSYLMDQMKKETKEINMCKQRLQHLHKILQKINNLTDENGTIDLSRDPELVKLLEEAKAMGIQVKDKMKLTAHERNALRENINLVSEELNLNINMQMNTVSSLHKEWDQSFMLLKSCIATIKKAEDEHIRGIRGS